MAVKAAAALAILIVGWIIANSIAGFVRNVSERSGRISATLIPLFVKLTSLALKLVVVLSALNQVGVDTTGFFAVLGTLGLAIGLALKDTMSDAAAGIALLILRPFDVGEAVDLGGTAGVVTAIDIFQTKLTSFEGVPIVLNNSDVRSKVISNYTRAETRRTDLSIGIGYGDDIAKAKAAIQAVIDGEARIVQELGTLVNVASLDDSAVTLLVRYHTKAGDFFDTKLDMTRAIKERLDQEGVSIPFPQRDLHVISGDATKVA